MIQDDRGLNYTNVFGGCRTAPSVFPECISGTRYCASFQTWSTSKGKFRSNVTLFDSPVKIRGGMSEVCQS